MSAPELTFSQGNGSFPSYDTSNSFEFDFGILPTVEATGDPSTFASADLEQIFADMEQSGGLNFTMPPEDYGSFLVNYDPANTGQYNFEAFTNSSSGMIDPSFTSEEPAVPFPTSNSNVIDPRLRIASETTNISSAVSPFSHVSPAALMSRTPSYNLPPKAAESEMSPVSAVSSPGFVSAPETSVPTDTVSPTHRAAVNNVSTRRVGGDWRTAFQQRISS